MLLSARSFAWLYPPVCRRPLTGAARSLGSVCAVEAYNSGRLRSHQKEEPESSARGLLSPSSLSVHVPDCCCVVLRVRAHSCSRCYCLAGRMCWERTQWEWQWVFARGARAHFCSRCCASSSSAADSAVSNFLPLQSFIGLSACRLAPFNSCWCWCFFPLVWCARTGSLRSST